MTDLSFLDPASPEPWASFLEQIDRAAPHLGWLGVAAQCFAKAGACIVALQDASGSIANPTGLDIAAALAHVAAGGRPSSCPMPSASTMKHSGTRRANSLSPPRWKAS